MSTPSIEHLRRAIQITEQIEKLEAELHSIFGSAADDRGEWAGRRGRPRKVSAPAAAEALPLTGKRRKRKMSPEARERIAAAQRARWAKVKK